MEGKEPLSSNNEGLLYSARILPEDITAAAAAAARGTSLLAVAGLE